MSFKLVGDDRTQQRVLKKRRVTELLANNIDEDESQLTKNGRYVCLVCSSNPVFDTIEMLCVHRRGKRHAYEYNKQIGKKKEFLELLEKRQQVGDKPLATTSNADLDPLLRDSRKKTFHALMTTAPYNPCIKPRNAASIFQPLKRKLNDNLSDDTNNQSLNEKDKCSSDQIKKSEKKVYVFPHQHSKLKKKKDNVSSSKSVDQKSTSCTSDDSLAKRYIQLKSSGWRLDANGRWFKDENVEFESDEDEPEPLYSQSTEK